jgi:hypothetical protein
MDLTYSIRALDDKIYGPYPLDSIQGWIQEGRINADTPMTRSDTGTWQRAGNFTELQFPRETAHPATPAPYSALPPNLPLAPRPPAVIGTSPCSSPEPVGTTGSPA